VPPTHSPTTAGARACISGRAAYTRPNLRVATRTRTPPFELSDSSRCTQVDNEKLEMKLKMARVKEWAGGLGPVPWDDVNEAALRLGMKLPARPRGDKRASYSSKDSHPGKQRGRSRERDLRQREKALLESPLSPDGDNSTHVSGSEIRDAAGQASRRPQDAGEEISIGRPALSTEGWDKGEPSIGASEEKDRLAGLGKNKLSSGGLRSALKSLHESIMGKASLQHAFYEFDKNKDNQISLDEFLEACSNMTTNLPESQLSEVCMRVVHR
jgi:hypothetical protein